MKPTLVIGLGNALIERDAFGPRVIDMLRAQDGLPDDVEFMDGGTDLLRCAEQLRGRELIVLVDACAADDEPGSIRIIEHGSAELGDQQFAAHHLSAVQSLELLRLTDSEIARARCVWVLGVTAQLPTA